MEFSFLSRVPAAPLGRFVESVWYARGRIPYRRELIAPTGSTVAAVVLGDPIRQVPAGGVAFLATEGFLIGPHDRPIVNEPVGETFCLGVVTTPVGCRAVFGIAPAELRGRVVGWGDAARLRAELTGTVEALVADPEVMLDHLERDLARRLVEVPGADRCARAVAALEADPARSIASVAGEVGVSHGHLDREFLRVVGLGPRVLARILRVRRLLEHIDVYGQVAWTELAAALGWFDQAHLIRDFKRHTGVTPSEYQAAQRREFGPEEAAPGFVPM